MKPEGVAPAAGTASVVALAFAALLAALQIALPASDAQWLAADPLMQLLGRAGVWWVVGAALAAAVAWRRHVSFRKKDLGWAVAGAVTAVGVALVLRAVVGSRLPSFIPSEESARPGVTLGLAAGLIEEVVFRLAVLPAVFLLAARRMGRRLAAVLAVGVTAAAFSLCHELGPAGGLFNPSLMATRFVIPGVAMSVVALRVSLTFLLCAHCAAHLVIPALFPG